MTPKVDTFEHNIAEEIKRKEELLAQASLTSPASQDDIILPKKPPILLIALITCFVLALAGMIGLGYFYFTTLPPTQEPAPPRVEDTPKVPAGLPSLSPTLEMSIGRFVTKVEKRDLGYVLTINNYSAVFAYMTRNENAYIDELASQFYATSIVAPVVPETPTKEDGTTTPRAGASAINGSTTRATSTPVVTGSTTTATTTTQVKATTTEKTPLPKVPVKKQPLKVSTSTTPVVASTTLPAVDDEENLNLVVATDTLQEATSTDFRDVTLSNQNMRVWTSGKKKVVYAFVDDKTVIISNSEDGILAIKSVILR